MVIKSMEADFVYGGPRIVHKLFSRENSPVRGGRGGRSVIQRRKNTRVIGLISLRNTIVDWNFLDMLPKIISLAVKR